MRHQASGAPGSGAPGGGGGFGGGLVGKGGRPMMQPPGEKKGKFTTEEFDQVGTINGKEAHEFDMESLEEKPWKKPGEWKK